MFLLKKQNLEELARETGFIQNSLEKVLRLVNILEQISRHPFLKEEYALAQLEFHYSALSGSRDKFKLEINYLHRQPIIPIENRTFTRFHVNLTFPLLGFEELLAGKIIALLSRYTPRDLYDVYQAAASSLRYDSQRLRSLILFYGLISRVSVFELFEADFDRITQNDLRRHLAPLLAKGRPPERVEMVGAVEKFLKPLLALTQDESEAIKAFYAGGDLPAEVLFPDLEIQNKVKSAPSLLWKMQNIQREL